MEKNEIYRCEVCGNIVEVLHPSYGELYCCGKPMKQINENTEEAATEKHIPVAEKTEEGTLIKIGEVPHPMEPNHYIEFVEIEIKNGRIRKIFLNPGDKPEFICKIDIKDIKSIRAYCNIHGLWKNNM